MCFLGRNSFGVPQQFCFWIFFYVKNNFPRLCKLCEWQHILYYSWHGIEDVINSLKNNETRKLAKSKTI